MIQITLTDTGVNAALSRLLQGLENPNPALKSIGELVMEFTKTRFAVSQDPYGTPWAPNQDSTLRALLHRHSRSFTRTGQVSAKGQQRLANKKPLIGESKSLSKQFSYRLVGHGVEVYSTLIYAAIHQFGGRKAQFPRLWGDIPARPFFPDAQRGLPPGLEQRILGALSEHLAGRLQG
ncbi:MAG: phage virion morphogenesis protein [Accumulibacter sp.]|jgi:phage gpG-like protein|uniref:phage virion morphogenesis protein n=1 Tax=Accumulibacter sp. TaxID=2053492 RepID=UPI002FC396A3